MCFINLMISRTIEVTALIDFSICHTVRVAIGCENCYRSSVNRFMLEQALERVPATAHAVAARLLLFFWFLLLEVKYLRYLLTFLISKEDFSF